MKISTNKQRIITSSIILIFLLLIISINYKSFIIDNKFNYLLFSLSIIASILSCILFAIKIETSDRVNLIISIVSLLVSILFSYIIIELLNQNNLFNLYIRRLIFNFIVIIFLHLFIYALSSKFSLSIILSNSIVFVLGLVNYTVTCFRGTPLVPWDVLSIKTAAYVASSYTFEFSYHLLVALSLFAFIFSVGLKSTYKLQKEKLNLVLRFCSITVVTLLTIVFYKTDVIDYFDFENNLWKPKDEYANNGFLASFVKQSKNLFNDRPENYSSDSIESILIELEDEIYEDDNYSIYTSNSVSDDKPNIIVIMSESFSDLTVNRKF